MQQSNIQFLKITKTLKILCRAGNLNGENCFSPQFKAIITSVCLVSTYSTFKKSRIFVRFHFHLLNSEQIVFLK